MVARKRARSKKAKADMLRRVMDAIHKPPLHQTSLAAVQILKARESKGKEKQK